MTTKAKAKAKPVIVEESNGSANLTNDKAIVIHEFREIVSSVMNEAQFNILQGRTPKSVIKVRPGKGGKTFSYVPHGYVTAQLNRAFGFDWDFRLLVNGNGNYYQLILAQETQTKNKTVNTPASIVVMGELTIRIRNPKDLTQVIATIAKTSTGEKEFVPGMTWGSMIKSAESDALKKAASRLGVALDLYWQDADEDYLKNSQAEKELAQLIQETLTQHLELEIMPNLLRNLELAKLLDKRPDEIAAALNGEMK